MQRRRKPNPLKDNDDEADAAHVAVAFEADDDEEAPLPPPPKRREAALARAAPPAEAKKVKHHRRDEPKELEPPQYEYARRPRSPRKSPRKPPNPNWHPVVHKAAQTREKGEAALDALEDAERRGDRRAAESARQAVEDHAAEVAEHRRILQAHVDEKRKARALKKAAAAELDPAPRGAAAARAAAAKPIEQRPTRGSGRRCGSATTRTRRGRAIRRKRTARAGELSAAECETSGVRVLACSHLAVVVSELTGPSRG